MSGFIYVMTNEAMPEVVKIGMTTKHPLHRANELYTTGVPMPFRVAFAMWVDDPAKSEKETHEHFNQFRLSDSREFFSVGMEEVAKFVTESYVFYDNVVMNADMALDEADILMLQQRSGLQHWASVKQMLLCLSDESIEQATNEYRQQCEERRIRYGISQGVEV